MRYGYVSSKLTYSNSGKDLGLAVESVKINILYINLIAHEYMQK